jgi:hypothetical protein
MAVAVPKRSTAPAPAPARTSPPKRRKAAAAPATAPKRRKKPVSSRAVAVPAHAPARRAPARAPQRARPKTRRKPGARVIPLAGRTAVAVRHLPDSGLMVRMTRGRAWIGVLGFLLAGIVALNVVTLSFAASAGKIDQQITALEKENNVLANRDATIGGPGRVRDAGSQIGLSQPASDRIQFIDVSPDDPAKAAARLAAAGY